MKTSDSADSDQQLRKIASNDDFLEYIESGNSDFKESDKKEIKSIKAHIESMQSKASLHEKCVKDLLKVILGLEERFPILEIRDSLRRDCKKLKDLASRLGSADGESAEIVPEHIIDVIDLISTISARLSRTEQIATEIAFIEEVPNLFTGRNYFDGIGSLYYKHLSSSSKGKDFMSISASSTLPSSAAVIELLNRDFEGSWSSRDLKEQWVMFNFKLRGLYPTHYTLKSSTEPDVSEHLKEWIVEGSNDGKAWILIDKRETDVLNGPGEWQIFGCDGPEKFHFIRFVQTGPNWAGDNKFVLNAMELFGFL